MKKIYTITTLKTIYGYKNPVHTYELGCRCVGWFSILGDAIECIEENHYDIHEEGYYPFCVIEEVVEGLYNISGHREIWYQWINDKYIEIEKPKELQITCGFGVG